MGTGWCHELAELLERSGAVHDLIVVGTAGLEDLVLLEGHARLTALFVGRLQRRLPVSAYVGTSPTIRHWRLF